jgi:CRISPR-associated protein Cst2
MSYLTAMLLIDVSAGALNNSGEDIPNARTENTSAVKYIRRRGAGDYPYFSAQAYRRWLRQTIEIDPGDWDMSPVYREEKVAYTDANPLLHWDDDLFGYMRAPSSERRGRRGSEAGPEPLTGLDGSAITRVSPLRVSTFVSIAPVQITNDFGVMSRQEGDPAPYEHQFYRATFQGLLSLDMGRAGVFTYSRRAGFQNLDKIRIEQAKAQGLEHLPEKLAYRLPRDQRLARVRRLIEAIPLVQGGAKQTLHYTDTTPVVSIAAVTKYGSHPFNFLFDERGGQVSFNVEAFERSVRSNADQFLSPVYIGWKPGYAEDQEAKLDGIEDASEWLKRGTPLEAFRALSEALAKNPGWLD